ncbi:MAG: alpha/beta fold hydrolase [Acidobacteriia bacterium]|nr:alpha/beta fold hydrolase [Terriglobia bacterium]
MNKVRPLTRIVVALMVMAAPVFAQPVSDHQVQVFGQKIHYLEAGSGPAVILLHGLGGDATNWVQTVPALAPHYHVFVPDQVGFGQSDKPLIDYRVATLVDFLDEFCNKLNISKASVVGNSLGGWTAMAFALAHQDKVDRMVLVDSAGYSPARLGGEKLSRENLLILTAPTLDATRRLMQLIFYHQQMITDSFVHQAYASKLQKNDGYTIDRFLDSIVRGEDFVDGRLGAIKAPTLIVWGREDRLTLPANAKALGEDISGSKTVILDECGHVPQIECAAPFNKALLDFLNPGS